jgi:hypothetical protein
MVLEVGVYKGESGRIRDCDTRRPEISDLAVTHRLPEGDVAMPY